MTEQTATGEVEQAETSKSGYDEIDMRIVASRMMPAIYSRVCDQRVSIEETSEMAYSYAVALNERIARGNPTGPSQSGFMADVAQGKAPEQPESAKQDVFVNGLSEWRKRVNHAIHNYAREWAPIDGKPRVMRDGKQVNPEGYTEASEALSAILREVQESPMPEPTPAPEPASGLAGFPDLRENGVFKDGLFIHEVDPGIKDLEQIRSSDRHIPFCKYMYDTEAEVTCAVLNNYNGLYEHAARLEARIVELEAAGVEDAEPVCTPETLKAWKSKMSTAIGPIELLKCFKVNALLSRVVAVALEPKSQENAK
jgi:hypothetical protein